MQQKKKNMMTYFRNIYHNEFQWSLVKSVAMFCVGVRIAQECAGLEIMPAVPH